MMKKLQLVIAILIPISLLAGFKPIKTNKMFLESETKMNKINNGGQIFLENVDECISIIEKEAQKISIQGVVMVAYIPGEKTESWTSKMKVVGKITNGKYNLLAIAYAKASEMAITLKDSGDESRKDIIGELGYRGGVIMKMDSGYLVAAFSGGTSQQDADVSKIGLEWLSKKF
jgi:hypothetical protein